MNSIAASGFRRYGFLAMPLAFAGIPIYLHAPDYYARNGGLSLAIIGSSLFLVRILDALLDPLFGWLADRYPRQRLLSLLVASAALMLGFFALFSPLGLDSLAWFCLSLVLVTAGYSVISIQLNSLGALWSSDRPTQVRITTVREGFGLLGLILAAASPGLLGLWLSEQQAYLVLSMVLLALLVPASLAFRNWYFRYAEHFSGAQQVQADGPEKQFPKRFFLVYALSVLASAIPAVLVIFFIRDRLELEPYSGLFLAVYFVAGIASMPLWRALASRRSHLFAWQVAMLVGIFGFIWAFLIGPGDLWQYLAICVVTGVSLGGELALPPALLGSILHGGGSSSLKRTSQCFALCSFLTKFALALGAGIMLPLLGLFDFEPGASNPEYSLLALSACYSLVPCVLKALALLVSQTGLATEDIANENYQDNRRTSRGKLHLV